RPSAFAVLEIDHEFDLRRLLNRQLCGLCTLQDFIHVDCCATVLVSRSCGTCSRLVTFTSKPKRVRRGSISRRKSICLEASISAKFARPVTLPPGWERLAINPKPTGSAPVAMTIGIVLVVFRAAR